MTYSARTVGIVAASILSIVFITVAFFATNPAPSRVDAEDTDQLLREYAAKDTDNDNLPDWLETLYGTDPENPESVRAGLSDSEAVNQGLVEPKFRSEERQEVDPDLIPGEPPAPASLTEEFSRFFFEKYLVTSGGQPLSPEKQEALIYSLMEEVSRGVRETLNSDYTLLSVQSSPNVSTAAYAGRVEQILWGSSPAVSKTLLELIEDYVVRGDKAAGETLNMIGRLYQSKTQALAGVAVPPHLMGTHLSLLKGYDTSSKAILVIANYTEDPLPLLGALSVLKPSAQESAGAIDAIAESLVREGQPAPGAPGALLIEAAGILTP